MRPTTQISMAIRHIGDTADDEIVCATGNIAQILIHMAEYLAERSMATRFDLAIARTEDEAKASLLIRNSSGRKITAAGGYKDMMGELEAILGAKNFDDDSEVETSQ